MTELSLLAFLVVVGIAAIEYQHYRRIRRIKALVDPVTEPWDYPDASAELHTHLAIALQVRGARAHAEGRQQEAACFYKRARRRVQQLLALTSQSRYAAE